MKLRIASSVLALAGAGLLAACNNETAGEPAADQASQAPVEVGGTVGALPQASETDVAEFRRQVDGLYRLKEQAFAEKDAAKIVNEFYAEDAVSFGPDGKPVMGRKQFLEEYEKIVSLGVPSIQPIRTHVGTDAAWEWVNFNVKMNDPKEKDFTFIMLFVFAKKDGRWYSGGDAYTMGSFPAP